MPGAFVADPVFEANPKQVAFLVQKIHEMELALPDFQRDFVWEPRRTAELLRTIMSRYPAGSLLFWRLGGENAGFAAREIEGAPQLIRKPQELILDGQQRLTALYQALTRSGDEHYYVSLAHLIGSLSGA